mmetsp:Transcript_1607/g.4447  ORF Transcript_1607/g.4447 Transcript_1607/m.4447 type:complete len:364 (+) Transcript_1607:1042-2133(+)
MPHPRQPVRVAALVLPRRALEEHNVVRIGLAPAVAIHAIEHGEKLWGRHRPDGQEKVLEVHNVVREHKARDWPPQRCANLDILFGQAHAAKCAVVHVEQLADRRQRQVHPACHGLLALLLAVLDQERRGRGYPHDGAMEVHGQHLVADHDSLVVLDRRGVEQRLRRHAAALGGLVDHGGEAAGPENSGHVDDAQAGPVLLGEQPVHDVRAQVRLGDARLPRHDVAVVGPGPVGPAAVEHVVEQGCIAFPHVEDVVGRARPGASRGQYKGVADLLDLIRVDRLQDTRNVIDDFRTFVVLGRVLAGGFAIACLKCSRCSLHSQRSPWIVVKLMKMHSIPFEKIRLEAPRAKLRQTFWMNTEGCET